MLNLQYKIERGRSVLSIRAKSAGIFLTMHNLDSNEWFWASFKDWEKYKSIKGDLYKLINDKPGSFNGMDEVVFVTWKEASAQKHANVTLRIWRSAKKKGDFSLLILDGTKPIYSIELRKAELVNLADSITWHLSP